MSWVLSPFLCVKMTITLYDFSHRITYFNPKRVFTCYNKIIITTVNKKHMKKKPQ